jgi:hypothetical protein
MDLAVRGVGAAVLAGAVGEVTPAGFASGIILAAFQVSARVTITVVAAVEENRAQGEDYQQGKNQI